MKKTSIFGKWVIGLFTGLCFLAGGNLAAQNTYVKVTSEADLTAGSQYLIVCERDAGNQAMAGQKASNYRGNVEVSMSNNSITTAVATTATEATLPFEITLEGNAEAWTLYDAVSNMYLRLNSDGNNLNSGDSYNWTISISDGNAVITPSTFPARTICYNASSPRFACYKASSNQQAIQLYKKQEADPSAPTISLQPGSLNLSTTPNNAATETITVTGTNLTSDVTVTISGENADLFEADASTLTASEIMAEGGKELTITYTPTEAGIHTATLSLSSEDLTAPVTATLNGVATKEVANLAALYNDYEKPNEAQVYKVTGDVVVTHKDSYQNRIWVQDAEQEAGKSIILFGCKDFGYSDLNVGDVLNGIEGTLDNYYGLLELKPTQTMTASSTGHAIYVDTVSIADLMVPNYQNALVCLKNVHFTTSGSFENDKEYDLTDGTDTIPFWVNYFNVYSGESIPEGNLYVTGIIGYDYNEVKITARSMADMVPAPCPVPTNLFADGITATSATINFQSEVGSYALRYAASEEALADAELVTFNETSKEITGLTPETQYFFQVKAICTPETRESEWSAVQNFTTLAEATPAMTILSPVANAKIDTAICFAIRTQNFELGTDGHFMVSVRGEVKTSENNDSVMWFNLVSSPLIRLSSAWLTWTATPWKAGTSKPPVSLPLT